MERAIERDHPGLVVAGVITFIVAGSLAFFVWMFASLPPVDATSAMLPVRDWPLAIAERLLLATLGGVLLAAILWPVNSLLARAGGPHALRWARRFAFAAGAAIPIAVVVGSIQLMLSEALSH